MQLNDGIKTDKRNQELEIKKPNLWQKTMFLLIFNDL